MRSLLSILVIFCVQVAHVEAQTKKGSNRVPGTSGQNAQTAIPSAKLKVVESSEEVTWDFILWTDPTGKQQLRGKPLSIDENEVHLEKKDGSVSDISLDRFCKEDRELLSQVYSTKKQKNERLAERTAFQEAVTKALDAFPNETSLRREKLQKDREKEFLKIQNGIQFDLVFPINDISAAQHEGCYLLSLGDEETRNGVECHTQHEFKISATEAASIAKGDRLVVRGKASFQFGTSLENACYWWGGSGHMNAKNDFHWGLILRLENPTFTVERTKTTLTLKERVKTRALELKTLEAKEKDAAKSDEREKRNATQIDPPK